MRGGRAYTYIDSIHSCVSVCAFVPVKQVNSDYLRGLAAVEAREEVEDSAEAASDDLQRRHPKGVMVELHDPQRLALAQVDRQRRELVASHLARSSSGVSICTFVLVKQVNCPQVDRQRRELVAVHAAS